MKESFTRVYDCHPSVILRIFCFRVILNVDYDNFLAYWIGVIACRYYPVPDQNRVFFSHFFQPLLCLFIEWFLHLIFHVSSITVSCKYGIASAPDIFVTIKSLLH